MDKKYYIYENGTVSQPYSIEDLRSKEILAETMVCEKFGTWKAAKDIADIQELIAWQPTEPVWTPPVFPVETPVSKPAEALIPVSIPTPAPMMAASTIPSNNTNETNNEPKKSFFGIPKKFAITAASIAVIGGGTAYNYQKTTEEKKQRNRIAVVQDSVLAVKQQRQDSIRIVGENKMTLIKGITDELNKLGTDKTRLERLRISIVARIGEANADLQSDLQERARINEYQLFRTKSTKDLELRAIDEVIRQDNIRISKIDAELQDTDLKIANLTTRIGTKEIEKKEIEAKN